VTSRFAISCNLVKAAVGEGMGWDGMMGYKNKKRN
jgi:hypothetical protein